MSFVHDLQEDIGALARTVTRRFGRAPTSRSVLTCESSPQGSNDIKHWERQGRSGLSFRKSKEFSVKSEPPSPVQKVSPRRRWRKIIRVVKLRVRHQQIKRKRFYLNIIKVAINAYQVIFFSSVILELLYLPWRVAFGSQAFYAWDVVIEAFFLGEAIYRRFKIEVNTDVDDNNLDTKLANIELSEDEKGLSKANIIIDAASIFPINLVMLLVWTTPLKPIIADFLDEWQIVQLARIFQGRRVVKKYGNILLPLVNQVIDTDVDTSILRLSKLLILTLYVAHLLGCAYYFIIRIEDFPPIPWATQVGCPDSGDDCNFFLLYQDNVLKCYLRCVFWALSSITGIGNSFEPESEVEIVYSTFVMIVGVAINMIIFGNIANLIATMEENSLLFKNKMEDIGEFAKSFNLSKSLENRLKRFTRLSWQVNQGKTKMQEILADLPNQLRVEVCTDLFQKILKGVGIFQHTEKHFLDALSTRLVAIVIPRNEYVFYQGDLGMEMYFLADGEVDVIINNRTVTTLKTGSYFGEIALLTAERRTAGIRCKTNCELLKLDKSDLEDIVKFYPRTRELLYQIAEKRRQAKGAHTDEDLLLEELPLIKKCPLFSKCSGEVARAIAFALTRVEVKPHEKVCSTGDFGNEMFFITSGKLKVVVKGKHVATLSEGQFFGEIALTTEASQRTADVIASNYSVLMKLSRASFKSVCSRFKDFAQAIEDASFERTKDSGSTASIQSES